MSKERARTRAEREREAAIRRAARAAEAERRERRAARTQALKRRTSGRLPGLPRRSVVGRSTGPLARRARVRTSLLVALLFALVLLVWVVRPDWPARLAALVFVVLAFPVLRLFLVSPR